MPDKTEIQRLRQVTTDDAIFTSMYKQDSQFRSAVDRVKPGLEQASPVVKMRFPTAMLNRHYLGSWETKTAEPTTAKLATATAEGFEQAAQTQEQQKSLLGFGKNVVSSGVDYFSSLADAVIHPIRTAQTLGKAALGAGINAVETVTGDEQMFNNPFGSEDVAVGIRDHFASRYQSPEALWETIYNDPVGFLSDISTLVTGVGGAVKGVAGAAHAGLRAGTMGATSVSLASNAARFGKAASVAGKAGSMVSKAGFAAEPVVIAGKTLRSAASGAGGLARFGTSQLTGLSNDTIKTIVNNTDDFSAAQKGAITHETIAEKVFKATTKQMDDLSDVGSGYETIRKSKGAVTVAPEGVKAILAEFGIGIDDAGKLVLTGESLPMKAGDVTALQEFLDTYAFVKTAKQKAGSAAKKADFWVDPETKVSLGANTPKAKPAPSMSPNAFLNARRTLDNMSAWGPDKSPASKVVARALRKHYDDLGGEQVPGLKTLDAQYAPKRQFVNQLQKEYIEFKTDPDGSRVPMLKEGVLQKISGLTRKGKMEAMARIKTVVPDIEMQLNVLRALEDVRLAGQNKVGTYFRGGLAAVGVGTGNVPAIAASILASPPIAIPILKFYGRLKSIPHKVLEAIVSKLQRGERLSAEQAVIMGAALDHADDMDSGFLKTRPGHAMIPGADDAAKLALPNADDAGAVMAYSAKSLNTTPEKLIQIVRKAGDNNTAIEAALSKAFGKTYDDFIGAQQAALDAGGPLGLIDFADPIRRAVFGSELPTP